MRAMTGADLTSPQRGCSLIAMTGLVKGVFSLAFIALLAMQPTGQWFCTATNSLCPAALADCCFSSAMSCCDVGAEQDQKDPCCIEMAGEWQVVPASALVSLPEPLAVDFNLAGAIHSLEAPLTNDASGWMVTGLDPPPCLSVNLALYCVRLI